MEIRTFAEQVLFSDSLEEKFLVPETLSDEQPGTSILTPSQPGRPFSLMMDHAKTQKRYPFPKEHQLHLERERGIVLHFFANHELLAMELMALMLLKFPEAPTAFRRGVAQTMLEERKHMLLYLERMQQLGIEFGEIPLNNFFWNCISQMQSPLDYIVQMSLTFEQANLDYSLYYRDLLQHLGDTQTARILDTVYQEEIDHVKLGVIWFNRWRPSNENEWDSYQKLLKFPMTPNRAKGLQFTWEGRKKAGFSDAFIQQLEVYHHSKGRPGTLFFFNPDCELQIAYAHYNPPQWLQYFMADYGALPMFLAGDGDTVLCSKIPSVAYLSEMQQLGFFVPEFLSFSSKKELQEKTKKRKFSQFAPWGWNSSTFELFQSIQATQVHSEPFCAWSTNPPEHYWNLCFSKEWSHQLREEFISTHPQFKAYFEPKIPNSFVCHSFNEVQEALQILSTQSKNEFFLLKGVFGASGQNRIRIQREKKLNPKEIAWIEHALPVQKVLILEPWQKRLADFGLLIRVQSEAKSPFLGYLRFLTTEAGQYCGHLFGNKFVQFPSQLLRFLHQKESLFSELLFEVASFVEKKLAEQGYTGFAGIDTFFYEHEGQHFFCPIVEVNPRYTMGHVALALEKYLSTGTNALWIHLHQKDLKQSGYQNFLQWSEVLKKQYPLHLNANKLKKIESGILFTNDPSQAQYSLGALLVQKNIVPNGWKKYFL